MTAKNHFWASICCLVFTLVISSSYAQQIDYVGSRANPVTEFNTQKSTYSSDPNKEYHIPVFIYSFRDVLGSWEPISNIQKGLDTLSYDFNPMNIYFEFGCINQVIDPVVTSYDILSSSMNVYLEANYVHSDAVTIFIFGPDQAAAPGGLNGGFFLEAMSGDRYLYGAGHFPTEPTVRAVNTHLLSHEMGHLFGLEHTFLTSNSSNTDPTMGACRELIDGSNCEDCGDFVCGTPASYGIGWTTGPGCTEVGPMYETGTGSLYTPWVTNVMDYGTSACMKDFSTGNGDEHFSQESRMKYFLDFHPWLSALESFNQPQTISVCNGNFQPLCGPDDAGGLNFSHDWYYSDPVTQTSILISGSKGGPCYTPTEYGTYTVFYTDQYGCSRSQTFHVIEGFGPNVHIDDIKYCNKKGSPYTGAPPTTVGLPGPFSDALSYAWTYDDLSGGGPTTIIGANGHQTSYMGDGTYCLTIVWSDANIPSLLGCTSEACFNVEQCCEPNPEFDMNWVGAGTSSTLTITNNPYFTTEYDLEQFILYEDCDGTGWAPAAGYPPITRTTNFNIPVVFTGLDESCDYKVIHRVSSNCLRRSFVYQQSVSGACRISVYPNPSNPEGELQVDMVSNTPNGTLTIYNMITGTVLYEGAITTKEPTVVPRNTLTSGQYIVQVNNGETITHEILIVR